MSALFKCEISGEIASLDANNANDTMVVTPSGHIVKKRLILVKLLENGGYDPFVEDGRRPLLEDDLIELKTTSSTTTIPRLANATTTNTTTVSGMLQSLQSEYDTILLELYDTRMELQQMKQQLTQALYQNDAAVRVVARVSMERDMARSQLVSYQDGSSSNGGQEKLQQQEQPAMKRPRIDDNSAAPAITASSVDVTAIPQSDVDCMISTWHVLHSNRKIRQKAASKNAISSMDVFDSYKYNYSNNNSGHDMEDDGQRKRQQRLIVKLGNNSNNSSEGVSALVAFTNNKVGLLVSSTENDVTIDPGTIVTVGDSSSTTMISCIDSIVRVNNRDNSNDDNNVDSTSTLYAIGMSNTDSIVLYHNKTVLGTLPAMNHNNNGKIIDVRLHPDTVHMIGTYDNGIIAIGRIDIEKQQVTWVGQLQQQPNTKDSFYSTGTLHPDGLIYISGTSDNGTLYVWDFKSQSCAETLQHELVSSHKVTAITISNNGYHVAAVYTDNNNNNSTVLVWDLRKLNVIARLNNIDTSNNNNILQSVSCIEFDNSGKYLAYCGICTNDSNDNQYVTVNITAVKDWRNTISLHGKEEDGRVTSIMITGLCWNIDNKISVVYDCTDASTVEEKSKRRRRQVMVFGAKRNQSDDDDSM